MERMIGGRTPIEAMKSRMTPKQKKEMEMAEQMEDQQGGMLTGGIGTAGVLTGGARDFVKRLDGGAKKMMLEMKDKSDSELARLYHDLGKEMFHSIKRVIESEGGMLTGGIGTAGVLTGGRAEPKKRQSKKKSVQGLPDTADQMKADVKADMVKPIPKMKRSGVKKTGSLLEAGNPPGDAGAVAKKIDESVADVPTKSEIVNAMTGGRRVASERMKKRGGVIKRLMKEKGMKLGEASKYLKEHPELL